MKPEIQKTIVALFNTLSDEQKAIVNAWTGRKDKRRNIKRLRCYRCLHKNRN